MRMTRCCLLVLAVGLYGCRTLGAQNPPNVPGWPTDPGVYYGSTGHFLALEQQMMSGGGLKHAAKIFVPGLTPQMVYTFRGRHAPLQLADARPVFYIVQTPATVVVPGLSPQDAVLVRLKDAKGRREVQVTSGGSILTFKAGFSPEQTPRIKVSRVTPFLFTITPESDLKPGEYMLIFGGTGMEGYGFGVERGEAKK